MPELDKAATKYVEMRDTRMKWTEKETEAKAALLALMEHHKRKVYRCDEDNLLVEISEARNVKVRTVAAEEPEEEDEAA